MKRVRIAQVGLDPITVVEAITQIMELVERQSDKAAYVATINAQFIELAYRNPRFARVLSLSSLNVADGVSLIWASKVLGHPLPERVNGTDLMVQVSGAAANAGISLYLLGGKPGAAAATAQRLRESYPGIIIAGVDCPPMGFTEDPLEDAEVCRRIEACRPDILFVGLGAPKQEYWMQAHSHLPVKVMMGIGGSFELAGGMTRRAPALLQKMGCEWLWRVCLEPRRLWKRYLYGNSLFIYLVLRQWLKRGGDEEPADFDVA
jgi:N-acetylglucosaminyldiphosphoundecaprenol N-acetyl-beta-D-mannosaminyltransferase